MLREQQVPYHHPMGYVDDPHLIDLWSVRALAVSFAASFGALVVISLAAWKQRWRK